MLGSESEDLKCVVYGKNSFIQMNSPFFFAKVILSSTAVF